MADRPPNPVKVGSGLANFARVFRHADFRWLWCGAFFSFVGNWVQSVAQGYLVYDMTRDESKLALVAFCGTVPVLILGPIAGSAVDVFNRRRLLIGSQVVLSVGALTLAYLLYRGLLRYEHILVIAVINGITSALEMPARQSIVSRVVPAEDLPLAVPINAMTFNLARVIGPAIGGKLLALVGPEACYLMNGLSYAGLIFGVLAIRADLTATQREPQPIWDVINEGFLYTFREVRLRTLFILETTVAMGALFYLTLLPAFVRDVLHLDEIGLGNAYTAVGVGAMSALVLTTIVAERNIRGTMIKCAMTLMGIGMLVLSVSRSPVMAYPVLALLGLCAVVQFNTTNTLFQMLSPERLRGRVLSMHIWALSGLGPLGTLAFGYLARFAGLTIALQVGAGLILVVAIWGWTNRKGLEGTG